MKKYEIYNIEVYKEGFLKGYAQGEITFQYNNTEYNHEFLYRIHDPANGESNTIVSIDYGYEIPYIKEVWQEIEQELFNYVKDKIA